MWNQDPTAPPNHTGPRALEPKFRPSLSLQTVQSLAASLLAGDVVCSNPKSSAAHEPQRGEARGGTE